MADDISVIRAELYRAKRNATEARDLAVQFETERNQLAAMLHESQKQVADFQRALEEARRLEPTCKQLQDANQSLQQQLNAARDEVIALTGRLEEEIQAKKRVEELRVKLEAEKVAMQRRRDELTSRLVEAESRATIAEEQEASMSSDLRAALAERDSLREALERSGSGGSYATPFSPSKPGSEARVRDLQLELQALRTDYYAEREARVRAEADVDGLRAAAAAARAAADEANARAAAAMAATAARPSSSGGQPQPQPQPQPAPPPPESHPQSPAPLPSDDALRRRAAELEERLRKMAASRDRLLAEFEASGDEVQRLADENSRLASEVQSLKSVVAAYDAQIVASTKNAKSAPGRGALQQLQQQQQALTAELLRTALTTGQTGRAAVLTLEAVERRLMALKARVPDTSGARMNGD